MALPTTVPAPFSLCIPVRPTMDKPASLSTSTPTIRNTKKLARLLRSSTLPLGLVVGCPTRKTLQSGLRTVRRGRWRVVARHPLWFSRGQLLKLRQESLMHRLHVVLHRHEVDLQLVADQVHTKGHLMVVQQWLLHQDVDTSKKHRRVWYHNPQILCPLEVPPPQAQTIHSLSCSTCRWRRLQVAQQRTLLHRRSRAIQHHQAAQNFQRRSHSRRHKFPPDVLRRRCQQERGRPPINALPPRLLQHRGSQGC